MLLVVEDIDRYGRVVGRVEVQGGDLGQMLVRGGYAWHFDRYAPNATELARLEQQARNANRGLWKRENLVPPWQWRDRRLATTTVDRDCSDFDTRPEAQAVFEAPQPGDTHELDRDGDGVACERLPGG